MTALTVRPAFVAPRIVRLAFPDGVEMRQVRRAMVQSRSSFSSHELAFDAARALPHLTLTLPIELFAHGPDELSIIVDCGGLLLRAAVPIGPASIVGCVELVHTCQIVGWCAALALDTPIDPQALRLLIDGEMQTMRATIMPRRDMKDASLRGGHDGFVFPMPPRLFDGARHAIAVTHDGRPIPARLASFQFAMDVVELERTAGRIKGSARLLGDRCPNLELALVSQTSLVSIARMKAGTNPGEIDFDFEVPGAPDRLLAELAIAPRFVPHARLFPLARHAAFSTRTRGLRRLAALARSVPELSPNDLRVLNDAMIAPALAEARQAVRQHQFERAPSGRATAGEKAGSVVVVVPVYDGLAATQACLESLAAAATQSTADVMVVADCPPDPALSAFLREFCPRHGFRLVEHASNMGFVTTCNAAIADCAGRDVILLNSDTIVPRGWLGRLARAARSAPDVASATPFSNNATILSYPIPHVSNPVDAAAVYALDDLFAAANPGQTVDIPTAVGFCMYVRREVLDEIGSFDSIWGAGYGEENDWCMRAADRGWRHVAAADLFVGHVGGASFGGSTPERMAANARLLDERYPDYRRTVDDFIADDPLWRVRARVDLRRLAAEPRPIVLHVDHGLGGGVSTHMGLLDDRLQAKGIRALRLSPRRQPSEAAGYRLVAHDPVMELTFPPTVLADMLAALVTHGVQAVHIHGFLNHDPRLFPALAALEVPIAVTLHDFAAICPRATLTDGTGRYCGEPALAACEACVASNGAHAAIGQFRERFGTVAGWRAHTRAILASAAHVLAPSADCATRIGRQVEGIAIGVVGGLERPRRFVLRRPRHGGRPRVGILGAISALKGFAQLKSLVETAARRRLAIDFVVVGNTIDDAGLSALAVAPTAISISGPYRPADVAGLLAAADLDLGLILSVGPETYSYTLSEYWSAGVPVMAYDLGAPAERIRATRGGVLVPPFLMGDELLDRILAALHGELMQLPESIEEFAAPIDPLEIYASARN
jgi:GT2 family glycosyltransferase/glycosyltransferase involved in cell wall biosynthesis